MGTLSPRYWLCVCMKLNPPEREEVNVLVTYPEASGRHKCLRFPKRPRPEVPPRPSSEAWSWQRSLGTGWPARRAVNRAVWSPNVWKLTELRMPRQERTVVALGVLPGAPCSGPFPRGAGNLEAKAPKTLIAAEGRQQRHRRGRWRPATGRKPREGHARSLGAVWPRRMRAGCAVESEA